MISTFYEASKKSKKYSGKKKLKYSWQRVWKYYQWKLLRIKEHPQRIARGFAAGVFAGCYPLIGLQFVMAIVFAFVIGGNKFTALLGTWISNPFTYVPLFFFNFQVGKFILSFFIDNQNLDFHGDYFPEIKNLGTEIIITIFLGSTIVAIIFSTIAYYLIINLLKNHPRSTFKNNK